MKKRTPHGLNRRPKGKPLARVSNEALAEHTLMQTVLLKLGEQAMKQNGIAYINGYELHTGATLKTIPGYEHHDTITLEVTTTVKVNPNTGAVTAIT